MVQKLSELFPFRIQSTLLPNSRLRFFCPYNLYVYKRQWFIKRENRSISFEVDIIYQEQSYFFFVLSPKSPLADKKIHNFHRLSILVFHPSHFVSRPVKLILINIREKERKKKYLDYFPDYFAYSMYSQKLPVLIRHPGSNKTS